MSADRLSLFCERAREVNRRRVVIRVRVGDILQERMVEHAERAHMLVRTLVLHRDREQPDENGGGDVIGHERLLEVDRREQRLGVGFFGVKSLAHLDTAHWREVDRPDVTDRNLVEFFATRREPQDFDCAPSVQAWRLDGRRNPSKRPDDYELPRSPCVDTVGPNKPGPRADGFTDPVGHMVEKFHPRSSGCNLAAEQGQLGPRDPAGRMYTPDGFGSYGNILIGAIDDLSRAADLQSWPAMSHDDTETLGAATQIGEGLRRRRVAQQFSIGGRAVSRITASQEPVVAAGGVNGGAPPREAYERGFCFAADCEAFPHRYRRSLDS